MNRNTWSDEIVAKKLSDICNSIGKFPSAATLREMGRNDLAVQISRRGGFVSWSKKIGFQRTHSDTDTGWNGELMAINILSKRYDVDRHTTKSPWDITINKVLRIDVKSSSYSEYGACRGWFYRVGKLISADFLMLLQLDTGDFYFIPWSIAPTTNITISRDGGKYASYKNNFTVIDEAIRLRAIEKSKYLSGN